MNQLIDDLARISASAMPRRRALGLMGGALTAAVFAAFGVRPADAAPHATCTSSQFACGNGTANSICCSNATCCAKHGNDAACCAPNQCVCSNGTCASSTGGACPKNCTKCTNPGS
jgi:hypothetical protein